MSGFKELIDVGLAAIERGWIDAERFTSTLSSLRDSEVEPSVEQVWVGEGKLSQLQLDQLRTMNTAPAPGPELKQTRHLPTSVNRPEPTSTAAASFPERYLRLNHLGVGGMGYVVECVDRRLERRVALKTIRSDRLSESNQRMLEREARLTGSLEHPSIMPVYDLGVSSDEQPFYVMRLMRQPTLEKVIFRLRESEEARREYTLRRLLRYFIQVCEGVEYAHSRGVIHCDLKPSNVVLGSFGEVLVLDWGMAYELDEAVLHRGGTPGYMAPEQLSSEARPNARTDVFGLGAILYEILCFQQAFDALSWSKLIDAMSPTGIVKLQPPTPPHLRATDDWPINGELEGICLKALMGDPMDRFGSVREMADAVDAFLEGTKELERRRAHADELIAQGDMLADRHREFTASRPEQLAELEAIRARIAPWAPPELKRELWEAEERQAVTDGLAVRTLQAAVAAYEQALDAMPGHRVARRGLAGLYWMELERAQERRDELERIYFEELFKQYDDGELPNATRHGSLTVRCTGGVEQARVSLATYTEQARQLVASRDRTLGAPPLEAVSLPPGSYLITVRAAGSIELRAPVLMRAGVPRVFELDLAAARAATPDEIYIPGGPALVGREGDTASDELVEVDVPSFYIDARPTTFRQYLAYLEELVRLNPEAAARHAPRGRDDLHYWDWNGSMFVPTRITEFGTDRNQLLSLPVFGIDARSALAYAAWRSHKTGRAYRLPNEREWEKAARGVDGRRYPWGDHFDAAFCKMRLSRPGPAGPEPSGAFAGDISPYGVRDMAGGAADWVAPVADRTDGTPTGDGARHFTSRGGAWCDWQIDCDLGVRRTYLKLERSPRISFRLARSA